MDAYSKSSTEGVWTSPGGALSNISPFVFWYANTNSFITNIYDLIYHRAPIAVSVVHQRYSHKFTPVPTWLNFTQYKFKDKTVGSSFSKLN